MRVRHAAPQERERVEEHVRVVDARRARGSTGPMASLDAEAGGEPPHARPDRGGSGPDRRPTGRARRARQGREPVALRRPAAPSRRARDPKRAARAASASSADATRAADRIPMRTSPAGGGRPWRPSIRTPGPSARARGRGGSCAPRRARPQPKPAIADARHGSGIQHGQRREAVRPRAASQFSSSWPREVDLVAERQQRVPPCDDVRGVDPPRHEDALAAHRAIASSRTPASCRVSSRLEKRSSTRSRGSPAARRARPPASAAGARAARPGCPARRPDAPRDRHPTPTRAVRPGCPDG